MRLRKDFRARALTTSSVLAIAASVAAGFPAFAQEAEECEGRIDENGVCIIEEDDDSDADAVDTEDRVVVTGSRIQRQDFQANSPLVTVTSEEFENNFAVSVEAVMNELPQFIPESTQFDTVDVQGLATSTPGATTLSMRGLGSNRNLVLVDGRRGQPTNASLVVDANSIPSSAIARVEAITGGASAVYGADAVGGVTNFILKRNYEGMEVSTRYGLTELGDAKSFQVSMMAGANLDGGRGNVMFGGEHSTRGVARRDAREFYRAAYEDPSSGYGAASRVSDTYLSRDTANLPSQAVVDEIFADVTPAGTVWNRSEFWVAPTGSVYTLYNGLYGPNGGNPDAPGGQAAYDGPLLNENGAVYRFFDTSNDYNTLRENNTEQFASTPLERYSMFGRFNYDITEDITAFMQGTFSYTHTETTLQYSPAVSGWGVEIPFGREIYAPSLNDDGSTVGAFLPGGAYGTECAPTGGCTETQAFPLPDELRRLLESRPDQDADYVLNRSLDFLGYRGSQNDNTIYQFVVGLEGTLPFKDWTWETSVSHGRTSLINTLVGFASLENFRAIAREPNFGRNAVIIGNTDITEDGFGGHQVTCESGIPFFEPFEITQDCIDAIEGDIKNVTDLTQNIAELNLQGGLFDLPAGQLRGAVGVSYRENTVDYGVAKIAQVSNVADLPIGIFGNGATSASGSVSEAYGELLIPLLGDLPFAQAVDIELGYRYSDYDSVGGVDTYKLIGSWQVVDWLRFRAGYNLATRAPNLGELYQGLAQTTGGRGDDPCLSKTNYTFGNFEETVEGPDGGSYSQYDTNFDDVLDDGEIAALPQQNHNVVALCNALIDDPNSDYSQDPYNYGRGDTTVGGSGLINRSGNPDLDPEVANTYTAGFVVASPFDHPLLNSVQFAIDYWLIEVEDVIGLADEATIYELCFNPEFNEGLDPNNFYCQRLSRYPGTGEAGPVELTYRNLGFDRSSGVDIQFRWGADFEDMGLDMIPGSLSVSSTATYALDNVREEIAGIQTTDYTGTTFGQPEYRVTTSIGYRPNRTMSLNASWRYVPPFDHWRTISDPDTDYQGTGSYNIVDLSGSYRLNSQISLRAGVSNLFDREPEITNRSSTSSGAGYTSSYYDTLGRRFYIGASASF